MRMATLFEVTCLLTALLVLDCIESRKLPQNVGQDQSTQLPP